MATKTRPVTISINGYCIEILDLQLRHRPLKIRYENTGTRSTGSSSRPQEKHFDRPLDILRLVLMRYMTTFKKLPMIVPNINTSIRMSVVIIYSISYQIISY